MFRLRDSFIYLVFFILVCAITAKKVPTVSPWSRYVGKSVYSRSLGASIAPAMDTINVPYAPKESSFFPKFVDPKMMISKKTDFLSNLFSGLGLINYPIKPSEGFFNFETPKAIIYARNIESNPSKDVPKLEEIFGPVNSEDNVVNNEVKRGIYGPMGPKFGPVGPKLGLMSPKLASFISMPPEYTSRFGFPFPSSDTKSGCDPSVMSDSRKKRNIASTVTSYPNFIPQSAYPRFNSIAEKSESASAPQSLYPPAFAAYGTFGANPIVDPSGFIVKKTGFLNALFSNLATSTPSTDADIPTPKSSIVPPGFWLPFGMTSPASVPKSTIVPPDFWLPSSIIPNPGEYTEKVATFLDKLFHSIKLNKTIADSDPMDSTNKIVRSLGLEAENNKVEYKRSIEDLQTITAAKDAIVNSIITELASLKTEMYNNLNDLIMLQKSVATSASKKPVKPFKAAFAGLWEPTVDYTLPFKQKMAVLSQIFDTLTELQKNITTAISDAIKNGTTSTETPASNENEYQVEYKTPNNYLFNVTLLDAVKGTLADLNKPKSDYPPTMPFWMAYTKAGTIKRNVDHDYIGDVYENNHNDDSDQHKRAIKMSMHQGYQGMPSGSVESVQAGGGSAPGQQGGGIKLLESQNNDYDGWNKWADWQKYLNNPYNEHRHHHQKDN